MTAPAAPRIYVRQNGSRIYVRWQPVVEATDYNLYVGDTVHPTGIEDSIEDDELGSDGWFFDITSEQAGIIYVRMTALNALAEESGYSNEVQVNLRGESPNNQPTNALNHIRKGARYHG